ncbi:MAG: hypothetical protein QXJ74_03995 [Nitrososphaera sp.]|uniref:hypothetical protein n=1 Tax=Nitrososphaera sp. TaxID=1971748 RepID=UPI001790384E|nr:hypothetical protein [Nitrososphaera sp.]NWG37803.1 hypothetical protein [Nitrososphaera sp.]
MALADFILPSENIEFMSDDDVLFGEKRYRVIVTDRRFMLYSRRGLLFRSDDMISKRLDSISELQYKEKGFLLGTATISVLSDTKLDLAGSPSKMKPLFVLLQSILGK